MKKIKEDYLTLKEFQDEKIECATDGYFRGFDACARQVKELDLNFEVARLRRGEESEDDEEEERKGSEK